MAHVKMYTTGTCAYCVAQKQYLNQHGFEVEEVRVDLDRDKAEEMINLSGQMGVPFSVIDFEDGREPVHVLGFDQPKLNQALGIQAA